MRQAVARFTVVFGSIKGEDTAGNLYVPVCVCLSMQHSRVGACICVLMRICQHEIGSLVVIRQSLSFTDCCRVNQRHSEAEQLL